MSTLYLGVMSGTSRDALDGCLVSFEPELQIHQTITIPFSQTYKHEEELSSIDAEITQKTIDLVNTVLSESNIDESEIELIAFSGQTISHTNTKSIQAGDPQEIANKTHIKVSSDFRNKDIANGGMGAPLIPIFHKYLFGQNGAKSAVINIGGISNGTWLVDGNIECATDIGPGNCLMDMATSFYGHGDFDKDGNLASQGKLIIELKDSLMKVFLEYEYPRADDISAYTSILKSKLDKDYKAEDVLFTLSDITAEMIANFHSFCNKPKDLIFHGGGTRNTFLMRSIKAKTGANITNTDSVVDSRYMEACAFAYLAYANKGVIFR